MTNTPDNGYGNATPPQPNPIGGTPQYGAPQQGVPYGAPQYSAPQQGAPQFPAQQGMVPTFPSGAQQQQPQGNFGPSGKIRNPFLVWLFSGLTFGIYYLYWYYSINRELADFDRRIEVEPGLATVAQIVPIANLISVWNSGTRIRTAQGLSGRFETCSGGLGLLLGIIIGGHTFYYQSELNNMWRSRQF
ncbi:DUF4234 domain-containing protein [Jonesiaceae bacterium BS-20]|uniref:DUF4234 domain-containing protein n=1 Tax=Jonesiaceae bacterium BS-20 TaxID=3120821 RepID=A0AAU7DTU5_9MICO